MQHDLYVNPNHRTRRIYPFVVVLQTDVSEGDRRLVAPVAHRAGIFAAAPSRSLPVILHEGGQFVVAMPLISTLPRSRLRNPVGSVATWRDDLTRALDWLFFGI